MTSKIPPSKMCFLHERAQGNNARVEGEKRRSADFVGGSVKEGGLVWNKEWKWEEGERERERRRGKLGRDDSAREDSRIVAFILKEPRMRSSRTVSLITTCSHHSAHLQKHFFIPTLYVHV